MPHKVFVCYRRDDAGWARSILERIQELFGPHNVFLDVDSLAAGRDFESAVDEALSETAILLVLVTKNFLRFDDAHDRTAISDEDDQIHRELRIALGHTLKIIPVRIDSAPMPREADLPADIQPFAKLHALRIDHDRFGEDVDRLIRTLANLNPAALQKDPSELPRLRAPDTSWIDNIPENWEGTEIVWYIALLPILVFFTLAAVGLAGTGVSGLVPPGPDKFGAAVHARTSVAVMLALFYLAALYKFFGRNVHFAIGAAVMFSVAALAAGFNAIELYGIAPFALSCIAAALASGSLLLFWRDRRR